jgi:hypothetical protein
MDQSFEHGIPVSAGMGFARPAKLRNSLMGAMHVTVKNDPTVPTDTIGQETVRAAVQLPLLTAERRTIKALF